jgi:hypothetical protein
MNAPSKLVALANSDTAPATSGEAPEKHYRVDDLVAAGIAPTRATAWAWCRTKKLGHLRIGNSIVIPASALKTFLEQHQVKAER